MESLILLALVVFFSPLILSLITLVKIKNLNNELASLRHQIDRLHRPHASIQPTRSDIEPQEKTIPTPPPRINTETPKKIPPPIEPKSIPKEQTIAPEPQKQPTPIQKPKSGLEFMMGGKAAAFAGILILITGIVFLVVYAMQNSWIGPGTRIVMGLLFGGLLVGAGHVVQQKDQKLILFARVITGGGSALFYFSVFAAYGIYKIIGPWAAGAGLFASALAVFGLSMVYRAQSVAILGVLGAFVTPLLIGKELDASFFGLIYVALVNIPVILLGLRQKWQILYNMAFACTIIHYFIWLDQTNGNWWLSGTLFAILFYLQFAALGLLKLRSEQKVFGRTADLFRLITSSVLLSGVIYGIFNQVDLNSWIGSVFILLALMHVGIAYFAFKQLSRYTGEILAFLGGGLFFATLALPAQLDGAWVSLGWAIQGAVVAWFACRTKSRELQAGAVLLGLIGLMKGLVFDGSLYETEPRLFLNARFIVGLISAALMGLQGFFAARYVEQKKKASNWQDTLWWVGILGFVVVFFTDTFWTIGLHSNIAWVMTSLMLLATGSVILLFAPKNSSITLLGSFFLLVVPAKIFLIDTWMRLDYDSNIMPPFANNIIWLQLIAVILLISVLTPRVCARPVQFSFFRAETYGRMLNLLSLASGIGILTIEILRIQSDWADMIVTILWAGCALGLILFGMKRYIAAYRYFGLVLFGLTTLKVLFIDSSELKGLERIFAFMGTGLSLLALSFVYQKTAAWFEKMRHDNA